MSIASEIKHENILNALMQFSTVKEASAHLGVTPKTIYNHLNKDEALLIAFRNSKREILRETIEKVQTGAEKAVTFLTDMLDDPEISPAVKLQGAQKLLDIAPKYREMEADLNGAVFRETGSFFMPEINRHTM